MNSLDFVDDKQAIGANKGLLLMIHSVSFLQISSGIPLSEMFWSYQNGMLYVY